LLRALINLLANEEENSRGAIMELAAVYQEKWKSWPQIFLDETFKSKAASYA